MSVQWTPELGEADEKALLEMGVKWQNGSTFRRDYERKPRFWGRVADCVIGGSIVAALVVVPVLVWYWRTK